MGTADPGGINLGMGGVGRTRELGQTERDSRNGREGMDTLGRSIKNAEGIGGNNGNADNIRNTDRNANDAGNAGRIRTQSSLQIRNNENELPQDHKPEVYKQMLENQTLEAHCLEIQTEAGEMLESIVQEMLKREPNPYNQNSQLSEWVGYLNMTEMMAEEIVRKELIYA